MSIILTVDQVRALKIHDYATCFPMIDEDGDAYEKFRADIEAKGILIPIIVTPDNQILDGRNRRQVALEYDLPCPADIYSGDDLLGVVKSANLNRRHMTQGALAVAACNLENLKVGQRADRERQKQDSPAGSSNAPPVSRAQASKALGISRNSIQRAKIVIDKGTPELTAAMIAGKVKINTAATIAELPKSAQNEAMEQKTIVTRQEIEKENVNTPFPWTIDEVQKIEDNLVQKLMHLVPNHSKLESDLEFLLNHPTKIRNPLNIAHHLEVAANKLNMFAAHYRALIQEEQHVA